MDKKAPVILTRVWAESEASVIKSLLESYDIPCTYTSELPNRLYPVPDDPGSGGIRLFVPAVLEKEARVVLEEHSGRQSSPEALDD
jgi:hypothetical protein